MVLGVNVPQAVPRGPGHWKLNISFLEDEDYVSLISDFLVNWRRHQKRFSSLAKWWEVCKAHIKGLSINFAAGRSRGTRSQRDLLTRLAEHLKSKLDGGNSCCLGPYNLTLAEIAKFDLQVAQGAQVRSRVRWIEEGASSSAYFFCLEKKRGVDRQISALKALDGSIVSDTDGLCDVITSFYLHYLLLSPPMVPLVPLCWKMLILLCLLRRLRFVRVLLLLKSVLLHCKAWPFVRLLVLMGYLWNFILSFGISLVRILSVFSIPASVLVVCLAPSVGELSPFLLKKVIGLIFATGDPYRCLMLIIS